MFTSSPMSAFRKNTPQDRKTDNWVETKEPRQSIRGFGGCFNELGAIAIETLSANDKKQLYDELFGADNCNFNFCRLPIGANDFAEFWYSHNETDGDYAMEHFSTERDKKYLIPYIKAAQERQPQLQLFASPWCPPTWMKFPKSYNYGTLVQTPENLAAYALYFKNHIHVQNEPMSCQTFPSCVWTGEEFRNFIANYLGEALDGLSDIWLGTINGPEVDNRAMRTRYHQYVKLVMQDEACRKYIKGVSYQWCGKFAMQQTHDDYPELELIQSESECGDGTNTWVYAHYIFEMMRHYFRNGASAYIYWNMVLQPGGESTWGWKQNSMITIGDGKITYNPEFYVMKHVSKFVKRGAKYLSTTGNWSSHTLAFLNPDGEKVLILANPFQEEKCVRINEQTYVLEPQSFNTVVDV